jgi:hypothetical protein
MQNKKTFRASLNSKWMGSLVAILILPLPSTLAQSQLSLQPMTPVPTEAAKATTASQPAFIPLPLPQAQAPTEAPSLPSSPNEPKFIGARTLMLKELPKANPPAAQQAVVRSFHSDTPETSKTVTNLPVAIVSTFQSQEPKESLADTLTYFLDVNNLIGRPSNPQKMFKDLETDRKYVELATLVEPVRTERNADSVPYLWNAHGYAWESAAFCFSPLYFEQPNLERYGQGVGRPFASTVSAVKFVADVTTLPIAVICTPPWDCSCTLGHHRPGNCAPFQGKTTHH